MGLGELILTAIALSMDAFAVAICKGLGMRKVHAAHALTIALFFGAFQALMPAIGYLLGSQFSSYVEDYDHWIAFALLLYIGGKMIWESLREGGDEAEPSEDRLDLRELTLLAIATSIDALMVGLIFAFKQVNLASSVALIGCTTFIIALGGVFVGNLFGARFKNKAEFAGGLVLVLIGLRALLNGLGIFTI